MTVDVYHKNFALNLYGFSGVALNKEYVPTLFPLMDKMWKIVKANGLQNKGINVWVYEPDDRVFAGVELTDPPENSLGLEQKTITLTKYATYKHIGPYSGIKQAGQNMRNELQNQGFELTMPYLELYGHWTEEESKLETELIVSLK